MTGPVPAFVRWIADPSFLVSAAALAVAAWSLFRPRDRPDPGRLFLTFRSDNMSLQVEDSITARVSAVNDKGKSAPIADAPQWGTSDPSVLSVAPAPDGLSAVVTGVSPGSASVLVHDPETRLDRAETITVVPRPAVRLDLTFEPTA